MTSKAQNNDGQDRDADWTGGAVDVEVEMDAGRQVLNAARLGAFHLRRIAVFVPIFGVAYLVMGFLWFQDVQIVQTLKTDAESLRVLLDQPAPQPDLLLKEAGGWDIAYQVVLDRRIARPRDSDLIGRVISAAETAGLVVVETGTTDDGVTTLENDEYTVTPLLIKANGTLNGIERFLKILETGEFAAFEVQASMLTAEAVGYMLMLRGVYYSLPENYGDVLAGEALDIPVIPAVPVDGTVVKR